MVLRKPDEQDGLIPAPLSKAQPPYPTTPSEEHPPMLPSTTESLYLPNQSKTPAFNFKTPEETKLPEGKHDIDSDFSDDSWDRSDDDDDDDDDFEAVNAQDVPAALKPAHGKAPATSPKTNPLPDSLRAGPPAGIPIKRSLENISPMPTGASSASYGAMSNVSEQSNGSLPLRTNNPYLKMQTTGQSNWGGESSQAIWGDSQGHAHKHDEPVELSALQTPTAPTHGMQDLSINNNVPANQSARPPSPEQPPLIAVNSPTPQSEHLDKPLDANPWEANPGQPAQPSSNPYVNNSAAPPSYDSSQSGAQNHPGDTTLPSNTVQEQQRHDEQEFHPAIQVHPQHVRQSSPPYEESPPQLPPRRSFENPPAMPPRPLDTGMTTGVTIGPESPNTTMNRQRKEHYQIKHIRWYDHNKQGIRTSPILTQNANGPCPLLALVNALILSTPPGIQTALIDTLRTRETISLGLLLDAVFDELMSGRRGDAAQALPDVGELYKFLLALHTGLNVNPLFVPENIQNTPALTNSAGGFEDTSDMKLYRTFNIPLMHGWLPLPGSEAYQAFERVARSYETSQYVQFQEEELDAKLQSGESLTDSEQQMFTDIHAIKEFLGRWPTQLTEQGLKTIKDNLKHGQVAILFRNDHFSTLYKDPRTSQLVTLVTDQGYSSHDEIVWESLVDINGQGSQLFSGDFRSVDNSSAPPRPQESHVVNTDDGQGWTTVQNRRGNQQPSGISNMVQAQEAEPTSSTGLSRAEQEDHDLALALQLQEEEEDRQRRETEQRQRDDQASVNAIAAQAQARPTGGRRTSPREQAAPVIPPRRTNVTTHRPGGEAAPPPTYEEASTAPRYNPPAGHPANPTAPIPPAGSAYMSNTNSLPPPIGAGGRRHSGRPIPAPSMMGGSSRPGRRQSAGASMHGPQNPEEREKCVVM